mmetsp:Transcript_8775/g.11667  ORF Transcript_8775/g.11667 Transcript_8775/m.11667 type:complete len:81 (+) Transcript_8775:483-725(+)
MQEADYSKGRMCFRCKVFIRGGKSIHCEECKCCVESLDHHCGVFDRCIAGNNLKYFNVTLGLMFVNFFYAMGVLMATGIA